MTIFKKGDKVKIDFDKIEADRAKMSTPEMFALNPQLMAFSAFASNNSKLSNHQKEFNKHAKSGDIATITRMSYSMSHGLDGYANLEFDDGFKCGVEGQFLVPTKKVRVKRDHFDVDEYIITKYNILKNNNNRFKILSKNLVEDKDYDKNHNVNVEWFTIYSVINVYGKKNELNFRDIKRVMNKKEIKDFELELSKNKK